MDYSAPAYSSPTSHPETEIEIENNRPSTSTSASATAHPSNHDCYQVFINHRGPEVKKTFASSLYYSLTTHGLKVFLDEQEMQDGEEIASQIKGAIRTASIHVAIFSPLYAESKWCLDELALMRESGGIIIPVFFNVKPSEVRCGENSLYAKDLRQHEMKKRSDEKIEKWRNALDYVAGISGFELEAFNGNHGMLLAKVVNSVRKKLEKTSFQVAKHPTGFELESFNGNEGMLLDKVVDSVGKQVETTSFEVVKHPTSVDEKVKDFEKTVVLTEQQGGKPQVAGIVGLGGVGKTTLAKELFDRKSSDYSKSCLLLNVRENSLIFLQKKLFQSLSRSDIGTGNIEEGRQSPKTHLHVKALIILDDVDDPNQVDKILAPQPPLSSDSLVLITCRDRDVLTRLKVQRSSIYKLCGLNTQHSRELFCLHAFGRPHPDTRFESLVDKYLEVCDGLPLSLKLIGEDLSGKNDIDDWENHLDGLQQILPNQIEKILKITYDRLHTDEREIFLDIASFFIGERKDMALRIWDGDKERKGCKRTFQNLQNKSLVEVDSENKIKMHYHLRHMGRKIVEMSELPRAILNIDDLSQQFDDEQVITEVRGIKTARDHESPSKKSHPLLVGKYCRKLQTRKLKLLDVEDGDLEDILKRLHTPNLIWLRWRNCTSKSLPVLIPMENLKVLEVTSSHLKRLWQGKSPAPVHLRELVIDSPLSELPKTIGTLEHLELIILKYQSTGNLMKTLPNEFCHLKSLKRFELTNCSAIKSLPVSFGNLRKLEHIDLSGSKKLKGLPDSFGNLTNLEHIDLSRSENLESLPNSFGDLIRLKYLDLSRCNNLTISSKTLGNISTLAYINLNYCKKIEELPPQVAHQRSLEKLYCPFLEIVPSPLGGNLKELKLRRGCDSKEFKCLPISDELLIELTKLTVNECVFSALPFENERGEPETSRSTHSSGEGRTLSNLGSSIDMSKLLQLRHFELYKTEISEVSFAEGFCPNLQQLLIRSCNHLVKVGTLPNALTKLELTSCDKLKKIEGLCGLAKLQMLNIKWCRELEELSSIETLASLEVLDVYDCRKLKRIGRLAQLTKLRRLDIVQCSQLEELDGVEDLSECPKLKLDEEVVEKLRQGMIKSKLVIS